MLRFFIATQFPNDGDDEIPFPDPLGDAAWPLALLAIVFTIYKVCTRKRVKE